MMSIYPMITGIAIRINDPELASADHLLGLSLPTSSQNSEDRHHWRRVDSHPFLSPAFGPSRLINLVNRSTRPNDGVDRARAGNFHPGKPRRSSACGKRA